MAKIDSTLLPIKAHYFFFMAAAGSLLPFVPVLARSIGVSASALGLLSSLLPVAVLITKPTCGAISDCFPSYRRALFIGTVLGQALSLACLGLLPAASTPEKVYTSPTFWGFVVLVSIANICFNVANSLSDAICFEVLGPDRESKYGQQRVWGCVGWGGAALVSGAAMSHWSEGETGGLTPACFLALVFGALDTLTCFSFKLPNREATGTMLKDLTALIRHRSTILFLMFATLVGVLDGFLIYYLLWFLEEIATTAVTPHLKLIEGLVVAAQTLGGEVIFFPISGWILRKIGHGHCLTLVFSCYALRLILLSFAPGPWWMLPIELFMQGPTYALGYNTIVAYASAISPPGTATTVQSIAAGVDDSLGYSIGSLMGGQLYLYLGGRGTFQSMAVLALTCCISHLVLLELLTCSRKTKKNRRNDKSDSCVNASQNPAMAEV